MITFVKIEGNLFPKNKDKLVKLLSAVEKTGLKVDYSATAKDMRKPVSTTFDYWKKLESENDVEVTILIKSKDKNKKNSILTDEDFHKEMKR